jgi:hypothetical protein
MSNLKKRVEDLEHRAPELPIKVIWQSRDGRPGFFHSSTGAGTAISENEIEMLALTHTLIKVCFDDTAEKRITDDDFELER